jgi:6-phosphogluconolactonase
MEERGEVRIILAGGGTPRSTYGILAEGAARRGLRPERLSWFFGDERWVGRYDPQSNEGMARAALLGPIGAPEDTIHSWQAGTGDPVECAAAYGAEVRRAMGRADRAPDILILGLGADGHTASLFPGATAWLPGGKSVPVSGSLTGTAAAIGPAGERGWRLTLCPDFLRTSRCVVFLAAGAEKAQAFRRATRGDPAAPAAWIRGGETVFIAARDVIENGGRDIRHA